MHVRSRRFFCCCLFVSFWGGGACFLFVFRWVLGYTAARKMYRCQTRKRWGRGDRMTSGRPRDPLPRKRGQELMTTKPCARVSLLGESWKRRQCEVFSPCRSTFSGQKMPLKELMVRNSFRLLHKGLSLTYLEIKKVWNEAVILSYSCLPF